MVANPEVGAPKLRKFYVTFGVQYAHEQHPYWQGADPDGWLLVLAPDEEAARNLVRTFIGLKWAFLYDASRFNESEDRRHFPKGELAQIDTNGGIRTAKGGVPPTPRFGTSDPEYYGTEADEVVAARIEGHLKVDPDTEKYDVEYVHRGCLAEGLELFSGIMESDAAVLASELDWSVPYECPVCEVSIT
jgi:hypothetical protein